MIFFELEPADISNLNDADLRELVARLCEAELCRQGKQPSCVLWGGAQEAPDGGLDVRVKNATSVIGSSFVPRENTGFQVKKNRMSKASCTKEMLDKGVVKSVISDLSLKKGAYIIVSGKDNCSDSMRSERLLGMQKAVESLPNKGDLFLDFYDSHRLSTYLRQFPGVALWVRSKLGKPLSGWMPYSRWASTPPTQDDEFLLDEHPCVIDLNTRQKDPMPVADGIELIRKKLRQNGSAVRIIGLSGVGKTRFAQALFETNVCKEALPAADVIYADLGMNLNPTASELISYLIANHFSAYVVLDNCPPDVHRQLQKQISTKQAKISLLSIEYDISDDRPEETNVIHIEPSSEKTVSKLIQKRFPDLGQLNADIIAGFAGGNARLAIALASRVESDETLTNFSDEELFHRLFSQRKRIEGNLLESAEILSLVYSFNISQSEYNDELSVLAVISGLNRRTLNRSHAELIRRQLCQRRGNWRAVLPHALANRLASRGLQHITPSEINAELFKKENSRLFISCAHRLGYLHNFEPARNLACTWVVAGAPLHDITTCSKELLTALEYIAPVIPKIVLDAMERACTDPEFCSRDNKHYSVFVRMLGQLAYDDDIFDRAAELMLKFAETEKSGENNNYVFNQLKNLFSLYFSGTQATPERRQAFLDRLVKSDNPKHLEIANALFQSAFKTSHWISFGNFGFGARCRDYGWIPKTYGEKLDWYVGFIELLKPLLEAKNDFYITWAKKLLAAHFKGLWSVVGCSDILEEIVYKYASDGSWPEMWMSIKETLHYSDKKSIPELRIRLEALEHRAAPSDPYSEIEAYALINTWEHIEIKGNYTEEQLKEVIERVVKLGKIAASAPEYLKKLAPRLWVKKIDAILLFGKGIALGSADQCSTFEILVHLMQKQQLEIVEPGIFIGFIQGVYTDKPSLARQLQERVLEIQELKPHFVSILGATPIAPWGAKKLIKLAHSGELEAWRFESIIYGRIHESISDDDLSEILLALNELDGGVFSTLKILSMRFFTDINSPYIPGEVLRSVGRQSILKLLSMHEDKSHRLCSLWLDQVVAECLSESAPKAEISEIIALLCEGIESFQLYSNELEILIDAIIKNFPELVLDRVFVGSPNTDQLANLLFRSRVSRNESALNLAPVDRMVNWCNSHKSKINEVAAAVSSYSPADKETHPMDNPERVVLSDHIKSLLEISEKKADIVEVIFLNTWPHSWSGLKSEALEVRFKAFSELLRHHSPEVRNTAKIKLPLIEKSVREYKERESEEFSRREQKFE